MSAEKTALVYPFSTRSHADTLVTPIGVSEKGLIRLLVGIAIVGTAWVLLNEILESVEELNEAIDNAKKYGCPNCGSFDFEEAKPFMKGIPFIPGITCLVCGFKITML